MKSADASLVLFAKLLAQPNARPGLEDAPAV